MKKRVCPDCNYKYSKLEYIKVFVFTTWTDVECINCKQKITIDLSRRIIVAFAFGFWGIILNTAISHFDMTPLLWLLMISVFLIVGLYIFSFDTFKKAKEK